MKMKPETIKQRATERTAARKSSSFDLLKRLKASARKNPGFIWEEMVTEHLGRMKAAGYLEVNGSPKHVRHSRAVMQQKHKGAGEALMRRGSRRWFAAMGTGGSLPGVEYYL